MENFLKTYRFGWESRDPSTPLKLCIEKNKEKSASVWHDLCKYGIGSLKWFKEMENQDFILAKANEQKL